MLANEGFKVISSSIDKMASQLKSAEIIVMAARYLDSKPELIKKIQDFVKKGGGLIIGSLGWGWQQLNRGKALERDHAGNKLLAPMGIVWGDGYFERINKVNSPIDYRQLEKLNAKNALTFLKQSKKKPRKLNINDVYTAVEIIIHTVKSLPPDDKYFIPQVIKFIKSSTIKKFPQKKKPLTRADYIERLALTIRFILNKNLPPERIKAAPEARYFPGEIPKKVKRVTTKIQIDLQKHGWASTGLYASPGEVIKIVILNEHAKSGFSARIGAHKDKLWNKPKWHRHPEISIEKPLNNAINKIASSHGGLIYIEVPRNKKGTLEVLINKAVEAPWFVLGKTKAKDWKSKIRKFPAPWAELETNKIILTVPSESVRNLENPEKLLKLWDKILDCYSELDQYPLPVRPERIVSDVQISAGYMHSGYPIMTHLDAAARMVSEKSLKAGSWGLYHELGHNHQRREWTFSGTGEVTVNLFTLFVYDKICGISVNKNLEKRWKLARKYFKNNGTFEKDWKKSPFLALCMYMQIIVEFGWEPIKKVFAEYRNLKSKDKPKTDADKRDQWMIRLSKIIGRNLGPFFEKWKVPTSKAARDSIAKLPVWMPKFPD